jgi:hypothetical protein
MPENTPVMEKFDMFSATRTGEGTSSSSSSSDGASTSTSGNDEDTQKTAKDHIRATSVNIHDW